MAEDEQAHINRQLFELLSTAISTMMEMAPQVAVLRKLFEGVGVTPEQFDKLVLDAKAQLAPNTNAFAERVKALVDSLDIKKH